MNTILSPMTLDDLVRASDVLNINGIVRAANERGGQLDANSITRRIRRRQDGKVSYLRDYEAEAIAEVLEEALRDLLCK